MGQATRSGGSSTDEPGIELRAATAEDRPEMIELCRAALGWGASDPNERFFAWKHDDNPFGASPAWLALHEGRIVGVRVFMRWRFRSGSSTRTAVRAVDTATHPDMQGRGIFRTLTLGAVDELAAAGVDNVFNTPNDQSRPGYLKMGWKSLGRVPVALRVRSITSLRRVAGARTAASKWSEPTDVGTAAVEAFADVDSVERLLARCGSVRGLHTERSAEYLAWRYSFDALHYRAVPLGDRVEDGLVVFRLRQRGSALEATVCEVLAPDAGAGRAVGWILRRTGADYAIRCPGPGSLRAGFVPTDRVGPVLTWRPLADPQVPAMEDLTLSLGDVELF